MRVLTGLACGAILACSLGISQAGEWSQFRGPNNSGLPEASQLPTEWSLNKNIQWKVDIPGAAWSCPIVWGDKIFVTTAITEKQQKPNPAARGGFGGGGGGFGGGGFGGGEGGGGYGGDRKDGKEGDAKKDDRADAGKKEGEAKKDGEGKKEGDAKKEGGRGGRGFGGRGGWGRARGGGKKDPPNVTYRWEIHCLDRATGKTLWKKTALERKPTLPIHDTNTYASETPVADGERVYTHFGMHGLFAYNFDGSLAWKADLGSFPMMAGWGTGSSPALDGDRLFVQCDNEKESFIVALNKLTGKELWRKKRDERSSWSTPFIWKTKARTEVVTCGQNRIRSYNPENGDLLWELGDLSGNWSSTPVANEEMLFLGTGGPRSTGPLFAVKAGATGDITLKAGETKNAHIAWSRTKAGPPMASPLLYQGRLYVVEQRGGTISCYDAKTGEPAYYRKRIPEAGGFTSSPWAYDGKVFCLDDRGQTFVVKAGADFEVLATNKLDDEEKCWSSPAFTADALLLRTIDHLYSIKK